MQADKNSKSVRLYAKSTGGKENMKSIQSRWTGKPTCSFFRPWIRMGIFADNIIDESVDVEKILETQMMIETVSNAISQETT